MSCSWKQEFSDWQWESLSWSQPFVVEEPGHESQNCVTPRAAPLSLISSDTHSHTWQILGFHMSTAIFWPMHIVFDTYCKHQSEHSLGFRPCLLRLPLAPCLRDFSLLLANKVLKYKLDLWHVWNVEHWVLLGALVSEADQQARWACTKCQLLPYRQNINWKMKSSWGLLGCYSFCLVGWLVLLLSSFRNIVLWRW